jgi:ABC-2 type transport system ATP-binding protein
MALRHAGATVAATAPDALLISGLPAERVVVLLSENAIPFAEVSAHRASLEDAYLRLTQDAVEFRAAGEAGR